MGHDEARSILNADYRGPVMQGDVYQATKDGATTIAIVDGCFEAIPSVWHKEILWAISKGVRVFGSSSMGALRAAELAPFGMIGIGRVFEAFNDCRYEDDDEVAVWHGDADSGYRQLTDAMVDIRATTERAVTQRILQPEAAARLLDVAKNMFYKERRLDDACEMLADPSLNQFREWARSNGVSQKREDALELLRELAGEPESPLQAPQFAFQYTTMWNDFRLYYGDAKFDRMSSGRHGASLEDIIDELRLQPGHYDKVMERAIARMLSAWYFQHGGGSVDTTRLQETIDSFRSQRGLLAAADLQLWCAENGLAFPKEFFRFAEEQSRLDLVRERNSVDAWRYVPGVLRSDDSFSFILQRANDKRSTIRQIEDGSTPRPTTEDAAIMRWYFEEFLGQPNAIEDNEFYRKVGFEHPADFWNAVRREYYYQYLTEREKAESIVAAAGY